MVHVDDCVGVKFGLLLLLRRARPVHYQTRQESSHQMTQLKGTNTHIMYSPVNDFKYVFSSHLNLTKLFLKIYLIRNARYWSGHPFGAQNKIGCKSLKFGGFFVIIYY